MSLLAHKKHKKKSIISPEFSNDMEHYINGNINININGKSTVEIMESKTQIKKDAIQLHCVTAETWLG